MSDPFKLVEKAKSLGYACEVYYVERWEYNLAKEKQYHSSNVKERGYGVRVFKDGKVGFAFSTELSDEILDRAVSVLKVSETDQNNEIPPTSKPSLLQLNRGEDLVEPAKETLKSLEELQEKVNVVGIYASATRVKVGVVNTEGLDVSEIRSSAYAGVTANYKDKVLVTPEIYESRSGRSFKEIQLEELKDTVVEKVNITKSRVKLQEKPKRVILDTKAISELFHPLLSYSVNGENVFRKRSPLDLGQTYGKITVVDNPRDERSELSRSFDGEGQATSQKVLMERGVFRGVLTNWYWSKKMGVTNSASAVRSYMSVPSIGTSLVQIFCDEKQDVEDNDLVVDQVQGVHTSNWDTGEFGVVAPVAWISRKGEKVGVREVVLSGDFRTLLKGIRGETGSRKRVWSVESADLVIEGLTIVT
ncbi:MULTISPECIES: TldD/PmbA family protein [Metallosphaera]|uniref:TldD/PmbA family protein n=1 Tax=Metallosphaera TaxID=41980 RepID=UPI001F0606FE|nr:TldD/PmbA family protein [Metallosphaera sedula]MCH1770719.1 TldD/PmbA family protein [Metallosphaera sedula]MCP6728917.1 TldD/PmbA family protein [Metallosphaera sedula]BBL48157.1 peptidase U62 [Metallosphaera sedula]